VTSSPEVVDRSRFDPSGIETFRFTGRDLDRHGNVSLRYALDDRYAFEERFAIPMPSDRASINWDEVDGLLTLLHWVAGVSYYKTAVPPHVSCETGVPSPAARRLLDALYSKGLGEFSVVNGLPRLPQPDFPEQRGPSPSTLTANAEPRRVLVPVGGGKDSAVALEIVRRSGLPMALFSVGSAPAIDGTVRVAALERHQVRRELDPNLGQLNAAGALNGHVPVTAIISCAALMAAALNGFDAVALANERSASAANTQLNGIEVNHQYSKSREVERLMSEALSELAPACSIFSVLRPASELSIARAFARLPEYHSVFTSCNRVFRLDPLTRAASWCCDCDKCRFVFLILAPFMTPEALLRIFGSPMLDDERQVAGFALLTATGGHKPFECVGEIDESVAAIRLLANNPLWQDHVVVRRLASEVLPDVAGAGEALDVLLGLSDDHSVPENLMEAANALLGA
jgi:UDP-N-acetyl-alpha-D-muramoyl-L-alanyl-L-glutamate epimerase